MTKNLLRLIAFRISRVLNFSLLALHRLCEPGLNPHWHNLKILSPFWTPYLLCSIITNYPLSRNNDITFFLKKIKLCGAVARWPGGQCAAASCKATKPGIKEPHYLHSREAGHLKMPFLPFSFNHM
jgi:hypothetical protein